MSDYAWEKFHLAAELLRQDGDKRHKLAEAFAYEIAQIKEEDVPAAHKNKIDFISAQLSLPDKVETISRVAHPYLAVKTLNDDEIDELIKTIFELESELNVHSAQSRS